MTTKSFAVWVVLVEVSDGYNHVSLFPTEELANKYEEEMYAYWGPGQTSITVYEEVVSGPLKEIP